MTTTAPSIHTQVIINGAGPTGLALACQLIRYNIDFIILDKNTGVTPFSKAIGVHARTLEIYDQIGLTQTAIQQGSIAAKIRFITDGRIRGALDLSEIGKDLSPYPFVLMLEQSKNEQLMYDFLHTYHHKVYWGNELQYLSQDSQGVTATILTATGSWQIQAQYLVGCDGPHSTTRHLLGLDFSGNTFERTFYVADALIDWKLSHNTLHACLAKQSFVLFFPLKGEKRYRIVGVFPEDFQHEASDVLYKEITSHIDQEVKIPLTIHDVEWFSAYKVHARHASHFSKGRVFLAGDAAHIHSPAGAQGMNTGIQDAYNLAWKLAWVLRGHALPTLLDSYDQERLANAKHLLQTTDRLFKLVAGHGFWTSTIRMKLFPFIPQFLLKMGMVRRFIFPLLSQIGIHYRDSSLSQHEADRHLKVKAGDRMPYFLLNGKSIYDYLKQPKFHWLLFVQQHTPQSNKTKPLTTDDAHQVDVHILPRTAVVNAIFASQQDFAVLLRPDQHIALISHHLSFERMQYYLQQL